jgi:nitrogen regulatory protein PII-like uncharacterized protein
MKLYLIRDQITGLYHHEWDSIYTWVTRDKATLLRSAEEAESTRRIITDGDDRAILEIEVIDEISVAAIQVLRDLFEAGHLEDHYYAICVSEGLGWEGPRMLKWGEACIAAQKLMGDP